MAANKAVGQYIFSSRFVKLSGKSISHVIAMLTRMILLGKDKDNTPTRTNKTPVVS